MSWESELERRVGVEGERRDEEGRERGGGVRFIVSQLWLWRGGEGRGF